MIDGLTFLVCLAWDRNSLVFLYDPAFRNGNDAPPFLIWDEFLTPVATA